MPEKAEDVDPITWAIRPDEHLENDKPPEDGETPEVAVIDDLALSVIEEAGGESSAAKIKFFKVNPESGLSSRNVDDILEHLLSKC